MMWAWGSEASSPGQTNVGDNRQQKLDEMILKVNRTSSFDAEAIVNAILSNTFH